MPVSFNDRSLSTAYRALERSVGTGSASLDDLKGVLATIADKAGLSATNAKTQLANAVSTAEMMAIVKEGMGESEKKNIEKILDNGTVKLSDDAKKFLEQLVGRSAVNPTDGPVQIADMRLVGGKVEISGTAAPNVTVEAINLSTIPTKRLHDDNTFVLGTTDARGKLTGKTDLQAGDWLRLRTRTSTGQTSDWMMVRADQLGRDTRGAEVALFRIDITDAGNGKVALANNNNSRPVSEPFAKLQFTNQRTGQKTIVEMDDTGRFPGVPQLAGRPGDKFSIAATDGRTNVDFRTATGELSVTGTTTGGGGAQIADPLPHKDDRKPDGTSRYTAKRFTGPLVADKIEARDVEQGNIGDCFLPAAVAAIAHVSPEKLRDMMQDNGDGTYTFTFQDVDYRGRATKKEVTVDGDLYARSSGSPLYGASSNSTDPTKMELWWPLFEKAYAKFCGDYHSIGEGGSSADVLQAALGRPGLDETFSARNKNEMFDLIKKKLSQKLPVCMGTKDDHNGSGVFANAGVYGDHTYTVLDAFEKNGEKYLEVRNPWGESEPYPGDGRDDGVFALKLDDMPKWYSVVWSVE